MSQRLSRLGVVGWIGLALTTCIVCGTAQAHAEGSKIISFAMENLDDNGQGCRLVIQTDDGKPIAPEDITFRVKGQTTRITFSKTPLGPKVKSDQGFDLQAVRCATKGYPVKQNNSSSFVRLRFVEEAAVAMTGQEIRAIEGGTAIFFPHGGPLPPDPTEVAKQEAADKAWAAAAAKKDEEQAKPKPPSPEPAVAAPVVAPPTEAEPPPPIPAMNGRQWGIVGAVMLGLVIFSVVFALALGRKPEDDEDDNTRKKLARRRRPAV